MHPCVSNLLHISSKAHVIEDPIFAWACNMHGKVTAKCFLETSPTPTPTHRGNKPLFWVWQGGWLSGESSWFRAVRLNILGSHLYSCNWKIFTNKFPHGSGKICAKIQGLCHPSATLFLSLTFLPIWLFFPEYSPWSHTPAGAPKDNIYPRKASLISNTANPNQNPFNTAQDNVSR